MKLAILSDFHLGYEKTSEDSYLQAKEAIDAASEKADVLPAVCTKCGGKAVFTQRIIEKDGPSGEKIRYPANYNEPVEVIGGTNLYEARCRTHHEVPGRPVK